MMGELNETEINNILSSQVIGRLACADGKYPYIIPLTYTFDGKFIYGQVLEGKKLDIIRKNPNVCFQVDSVLDIYNWQSVILYGHFEEQLGEDLSTARDILFSRVMPLMTSSSVHLHGHAQTTENINIEDHRIKPVMFKIRIKEKTGRFQKV